jgi:hypothetical protein
MSNHLDVRLAEELKSHPIIAKGRKIERIMGYDDCSTQKQQYPLEFGKSNPTLLPPSRLDLLDLSAISEHNLESIALIGSGSRIRLSETVAGHPPPRMFVAHFSRMQVSLQRTVKET